MRKLSTSSNDTTGRWVVKFLLTATLYTAVIIGVMYLSLSVWITWGFNSALAVLVIGTFTVTAGLFAVAADE